jgi:hypothetical protein
MTSIQINDIGAVTEFGMDMNEPGLYVLRGKQGAGKTTVLRTVQLVTDGRTDVTPTKRDGSKRGEATVAGKTLRIAKQIREEGEEGEETEAADSADQYSLKCSEQPSKGFKAALQKLVPHVLDCCGITQEGYDDGLKVIGASFSWKDGEMSATISAAKKIEGCNSPLILHTPHQSEMTGDALGGKFLSPECVKALHSLAGHAQKYVKGKRGKPELFDQDAAED